MMKLSLLLLTFVFSSLLAPAQDIILSADSIMKIAYEQAGREKKNVFVIFTSSWCGWCHKMDVAMNDASCKKTFENNYVIVHLVVEESKDKKDFENPGSDVLKSKWLGEKAGLPFWVILDANENVLADSYIRKAGVSNEEPGINIQCPSSDEEIAAFLKILRNTSTITDTKLVSIGKRFKKNKQTL